LLPSRLATHSYSGAMVRTVLLWKSLIRLPEARS
jgi:hypothetical protein